MRRQRRPACPLLFPIFLSTHFPVLFLPGRLGRCLLLFRNRFMEFLVSGVLRVAAERFLDRRTGPAASLFFQQASAKRR